MPRTISERADLLPDLGELFREHGYEGATLALISARTKLGKGSLYHFFPGGKEEMANAVLDDIDGWFETHIFRPLRTEADAQRAIVDTLDAVETYFRSGRRVCLVGVFALDETRDRFADRVRSYFLAWRDALAQALAATGLAAGEAKDLSEEVLALIQGGLVLARALNDPTSFQRVVARAKARLGLTEPLPSAPPSRRPPPRPLRS